jgi:hypothetical protein
MVALLPAGEKRKRGIEAGVSSPLREIWFAQANW